MECLTFDTVLIYIQHTHRPIGNYLLASYKGDITPYVLPTDPKSSARFVAREEKMMLFRPTLKQGTRGLWSFQDNRWKNDCSGNKGHPRFYNGYNKYKCLGELNLPPHESGQKRMVRTCNHHLRRTCSGTPPSVASAHEGTRSKSP